VRISVANYNISNLTAGVAQTRDFFKQEGIEAEIIRMNPNVATMALVSNDVGYSTLVGSVVGAALKGAKVRMIACSQDRTPLALVAKPELKSVKDLKGRIIAVGSYGSTPDLVARMVVKHAGLDPESDIKVLALGTDGARLGPSRKASSTLSSSPRRWISRLRKWGLTSLAAREISFASPTMVSPPECKSSTRNRMK
jgi:hypothetical protein